jgi:hypothetical protein
MFFNGYGDKNQRAGQVADDFRSMHGAFPPGSWNVSPTWHIESDVIPPIGTTKVWSFNITGHPSYSLSSVKEAALKVDLFFDPQRVQTNDSIWICDNATNTYYQLMSPANFTAWTQTLKSTGTRERRWVSVAFDLTPGTGNRLASVYDIDARGNDIAGRHWGPFMVLPSGMRNAVVNAAANGDLQGYVLSQTPFSHAELMVKY